MDVTQLEKDRDYLGCKYVFLIKPVRNDVWLRKIVAPSFA